MVARSVAQRQERKPLKRYRLSASNLKVTLNGKLQLRTVHVWIRHVFRISMSLVTAFCHNRKLFSVDTVVKVSLWNLGFIVIAYFHSSATHNSTDLRLLVSFFSIHVSWLMSRVLPWKTKLRSPTVRYSLTKISETFPYDDKCQPKYPLIALLFLSPRLILKKKVREKKRTFDITGNTLFCTRIS